jgi:hypothetical protein
MICKVCYYTHQLRALYRLSHEFGISVAAAIPITLTSSVESIRKNSIQLSKDYYNSDVSFVRWDINTYKNIISTADIFNTIFADLSFFNQFHVSLSEIHSRDRKEKLVDVCKLIKRKNPISNIILGDPSFLGSPTQAINEINEFSSYGVNNIATSFGNTVTDFGLGSDLDPTRYHTFIDTSNNQLFFWTKIDYLSNKQIQTINSPKCNFVLDLETVHMSNRLILDNLPESKQKLIIDRNFDSKVWKGSITSLGSDDKLLLAELTMHKLLLYKNVAPILSDAVIDEEKYYELFSRIIERL